MKNEQAHPEIHATRYDRADCETGVVHLGYGAFHRAHQAVFLDDYMERTGDLRWGTVAVNLRPEQSDSFAEAAAQDGYMLKSVAPDGKSALRDVRCHIGFEDWTVAPDAAERLLSLATVHLVTITVTESGYYTDARGALNLDDPVIAAEIAGDRLRSVYGYLMAALEARRTQLGLPLTISCCDNIRHNGKMLRENFRAYLLAMGAEALAEWVDENVAFPSSMVDRITPRPTGTLAEELSVLTGRTVVQPVMAEAFVQWVLEDHFAGPVPAFAEVGVTVTDNVDPYEETKIRVLNGGHTCVCYLAALMGIETFDAVMTTPALAEHFWSYEREEVLPALPGALPFDKADYLDAVAARFRNAAIGDTVARITADGMAKFPIFIRPTLAGALRAGRVPVHGLRSIASWYVFGQHVAAGNIPFDYVEPSWTEFSEMLGQDAFVTSTQLWGALPETYPEFAQGLRDAIQELEEAWPV